MFFHQIQIFLTNVNNISRKFGQWGRVYTCGRTDVKLLGAFRDYANAPKNSYCSLRYWQMELGGQWIRRWTPNQIGLPLPWLLRLITAPFRATVLLPSTPHFLPCISSGHVQFRTRFMAYPSGGKRWYPNSFTASRYSIRFRTRSIPYPSGGKKFVYMFEMKLTEFNEKSCIKTLY
jgi:hypothetical protein